LSLFGLCFLCFFFPFFLGVLPFALPFENQTQKKGRWNSPAFHA